MNVGVLEAVVGTDAQFELFHRAIQHFVHLVDRALGRLLGDLGALFKVDEDRHVILEQLGGLADGVLRRNGTIGPDFNGQLVVIGVLAQTGSFHGIVHFAHRRVNGVDRNVSDGQVFIVIAIGRDIAAAAFDAHIDIELAAFAHGGDVQVAVENFDIVVGLNLAAHHFARRVNGQAGNARAFTHHLERHLLQVEDDIGGVFDDTGNRAEFVRYAINAHAGNGRALNGAQQYAAQASSDGGAESTFEWLRGKLAETLGQSFGVSD